MNSFREDRQRRKFISKLPTSTIDVHEAITALERISSQNESFVLINDSESSFQRYNQRKKIKCFYECHFYKFKLYSGSNPKLNMGKLAQNHRSGWVHGSNPLRREIFVNLINLILNHRCKYVTY